MNSTFEQMMFDMIEEQKKAQEESAPPTNEETDSNGIIPFDTFLKEYIQDEPNFNLSEVVQEYHEYLNQMEGVKKPTVQEAKEEPSEPVQQTPPAPEPEKEPEQEIPSPFAPILEKLNIKAKDSIEWVRDCWTNGKFKDNLEDRYSPLGLFMESVLHGKPQSALPVGTHLFDKEGNPILVIRPQNDVDQLLKKDTKGLWYVLEKMPKFCAPGKNLEEFCKTKEKTLELFKKMPAEEVDKILSTRFNENLNEMQKLGYSKENLQSLMDEYLTPQNTTETSATETKKGLLQKASSGAFNPPPLSPTFQDFIKQETKR